MAKRIEGMDEKIVASAKAEFLRKGYHGASLRKIAQGAGTSTASIYTRYSSKEGLFTAVVEPTASEFMERVRKAYATSENTEIWRESYRYNFWTEQIKFIYEHIDVFSLLFTCSYHTKYAGYQNAIAVIAAKSAYSYHVEKFAQKEIELDFVIAVYVALFTAFFETVSQHLQKEISEKYILQLCHYFSAGWKSVLL